MTSWRPGFLDWSWWVLLLIGWVGSVAWMLVLMPFELSVRVSLTLWWGGRAVFWVFLSAGSYGLLRRWFGPGASAFASVVSALVQAWLMRYVFLVVFCLVLFPEI